MSDGLRPGAARSSIVRRLARDLRVRLGAAALGAGFVFGVVALELGERHSWGHRGWIALTAGIVFAGVIAVLMRFDPKRDSAADAREVDAWAEENRLPSDVPLGAALSKLANRVDQIRTAVWSNGCVLLLCLIQLGLLPDQPTPLGIGFRVALCAVFAVALGRAIQARVRRVPVMQELILEGQRRFAGLPSSTD